MRSAGLMRTLATLRREQRRSERRGRPPPLRKRRPSRRRGPSAPRLPRGFLRRPDFPRVPPLRGDSSLNAANAIGAAALLRRGGLERLTPTHDLDARQQANLARALGPAGARAWRWSRTSTSPSSHRALRVLSLPLRRQQLQGLRPPVRDVERTPPRRLRRGPSRVGGHGMPQHGVQRAGAERGGVPGRDSGPPGCPSSGSSSWARPAEVVAPLLEAYRECCAGRRGWGEVVAWVGTLPDANGRARGAGRGSLGAGRGGGPGGDKNHRRGRAGGAGTEKSGGASVNRSVRASVRASARVSDGERDGAPRDDEYARRRSSYLRRRTTFESRLHHQYQALSLFSTGEMPRRRRASVSPLPALLRASRGGGGGSR